MKNLTWFLTKQVYTSSLSYLFKNLCGSLTSFHTCVLELRFDVLKLPFGRFQRALAFYFGSISIKNNDPAF